MPQKKLVDNMLRSLAFEQEHCTNTGVKVLGLPIGEEAWVKADLNDMVDDLESGSLGS